MMSELLDRATLAVMDYLLEYPPDEFKLGDVTKSKQITIGLPMRYRGDVEKAMDKVLDLGMMYCKNTDSPAGERIYWVNDKSPFLATFLKFDIENTKKILEEKKRRLREAYTYPPKEKPKEEPKVEKDAVVPGA